MVAGGGTGLGVDGMRTGGSDGATKRVTTNPGSVFPPAFAGAGSVFANVLAGAGSRPGLVMAAAGAGPVTASSAKSSASSTMSRL